MTTWKNTENGATLVSILGGHVLNLALAVLGNFADVSGLATIQYPEIEVGLRSCGPADEAYG